MRIMLYLVSLIGFIILGVQLAAALLGIATYLAILLIVGFVLLMVLVFRVSLFAAVFTAETACSLAESINYSDIQNERERMHDQLTNPYYYAQQRSILQNKTRQANNDLQVLQQIYPFANNTLFGKYAGYIARRQFDKLDEVKNMIRQSHIVNLNQFDRDNM